MVIITPQCISDYIDYMKTLAVNHAELCHEDKKGKEAFFRMNIQELYGAWRSGIRPKGIALVAIEYLAKLSSKSSKQILSERQAGFLVIGHHRGNDDAAQLEILAKTEKIVLQIINRMIKQSQGGHPLLGCSISSHNDFNYTPQYNLGDGNYAGWLVTFQFNTPVDSCVNQKYWKDDLDDDEYLEIE